MIKSAKLLGFQKHKKLKVKFKPGLNVIVGNSDSGKSSLYRSIKFALCNDTKMNFINSESSQADVEIKIGENKVRRIKGKTKNLYYLNGEEFKAFGANVPAEIADQINMSEINYQDQHDQSFLLAESPGSRARYLNKLINIDIIDKTMSKLNSDCNSISREIKMRQGDLNELEEKLKGFSYLPELERDLESLSASHDEAMAAEALIARLSDAVDQLEEINISALVDPKEAKFDFESLDDAFFTASTAKKDSQLLGDIIEELEGLDLSSENYDKSIFSAFEAHSKERKKIIEFEEYLDEISALEDEQKELQSIIDKNHKELKKYSKVCPTCGQEI